MFEMSFEIPGTPVPKGRPRLVRLKGGAIRAYTPAPTARWEEHVQLHARTALRRAGLPRFEGAVGLDLRFTFPTPVSWAIWRRVAAINGHIACSGRPDLDNLIKALTDGFNGALYVDDAQVVRISAEKKYGAIGSVHVTARSLGDLTPAQDSRRKPVED